MLFECFVIVRTITSVLSLAKSVEFGIFRDIVHHLDTVTVKRIDHLGMRNRFKQVFDLADNHIECGTLIGVDTLRDIAAHNIAEVGTCFGTYLRVFLYLFDNQHHCSFTANIRLCHQKRPCG